MGHQALHFSKAIQRSVGWPFYLERREERGGDEEAPSISPMRGSARLPLGILGWILCSSDYSYWIGQKGGATKYC